MLLLGLVKYWLDFGLYPQQANALAVGIMEAVTAVRQNAGHCLRLPLDLGLDLCRGAAAW
jgi:hypothetical protein